MNHHKIALVGMPGSGKSTVGRDLACLTGWTFLDLDAWLIQRWSLSISEQFHACGETRFRMREREALQHLLKQQGSFVLATGGGTPIWHNQMNLLLKVTVVVWLDVAPDEIARRLAQSPGVRPLLSYPNAAAPTAQEALNRIQSLYDERRPIYAKAHIRVEANSSSAELAHQILQVI